MTLESAEAQAMVGRFLPEQWERVSLGHVKERSAVDCRAYYRHVLAPKVEWTLEESSKLRALATANKGRNVRLAPVNNYRLDVATALNLGYVFLPCQLFPLPTQLHGS